MHPAASGTTLEVKAGQVNNIIIYVQPLPWEFNDQCMDSMHIKRKSELKQSKLGDLIDWIDAYNFFLQAPTQVNKQKEK